MIYQCYPFTKDRMSLFSDEPYRGFGLEPESNKLLSLNCPELKSSYNRLQLTEYACFLWHWRNPGYDTDSWIGTTSIRQLNKFPYQFTTKKEVREAVQKHQVVGWGEYDLYSQGVPITLKEQAERCHPGLNDYMEQVFADFDHSFPSAWSTFTSGFFANYWVMDKELFTDFMEFSWPMVEWSLNNVENTDYYKNHPEYGTVSRKKATGYFMERLFLLWYLKRGIVPHNPATPISLSHG